MPTSPQTEVPGALALVFRYVISGYSAQAPGVVLVNSDGQEISFGTGTSSQQVQGNVAGAATDAGNPVKVGFRYNTALPTYTNGQRTDAQTDVRGNLNINIRGTDNQAGASVTNVAADANTNTVNAVNAFSYSAVFNGTTWDRQRGDTSGTDVILGARPTAGGATQFRRLATADTNLVAIKATPGRVYGYVISNTTASAKFVKLYNKATAPVIATDNALLLRTIYVPPNGIAAYHLGQGMGGFTSGIAMAATGAIGDTDTTALAANDLIIHIDYA